MKVSIVIPVFNKIEFTRQCLDRIGRHTGDIDHEVIIVDNASSDGTADWFSDPPSVPFPLRYHRNAENAGFAKGNNIGAALARGEYLVFLNNDTLVQPGWLTQMIRIAEKDRAVGVVGIKQLFPYTNVLYHTGVVFFPGGIPQHLYPHLDASLSYVNKEREYQAVTGACLLIGRALFQECGAFDEAYVNGYEDTDLCMTVARRGRKIVCCTSAFIYHYGQISEGRTAADDRNAALFSRKWAGQIRVDRDDYLARDAAEIARASAAPPAVPPVKRFPADGIYLADDLAHGSALTWVNAELALSLSDRGVPVRVNASELSSTLPASVRRRLQPLVVRDPGVGGVQIKWSHYWPRHLNFELTGDINLEVFVINYTFATQTAEPWDYWLQCVRQNHRDKLPVSEFCRSVLLQLGIPEHECHVLHHGYSREIAEVEAPRRTEGGFRFLTVTNSHDLGRYNTEAIIAAYDTAFDQRDGVTLVIKDYGGTSRDSSIRQRLTARRAGPRIDYVSEFTDKRELIELYKSCDAFVSAHRGEGFSMKILDAVACGLPVITPLFGGPRAYCRPETTFPVAFTLTPVGDCLDTRSLTITNQPVWAEVDSESLRDQMRRVFEDPAAARNTAAVGQAMVLSEFAWDRMADRLLQIVAEVRGRRPAVPRATPVASKAERSPYWLGLRVSVVVPTRNRKDKLITCLQALARQSILQQEFEVLVIDDGSSDGTEEALRSCTFPFAMRYLRQDPSGPGAARNLAIERAEGEIVLFIGDDIYADEHLLEEHLLAHAANPDPGAAILGHIRWPDSMRPNAVMDYVCGEAMLQFAYTYIPHAPVLDHRFFYTSNISLKRQFLLEAADAGIRFDPCFRHAAFEDSEFAFRLMPRGLRLVYADKARAAHDHWMDLDSFARREQAAGEMAVVFYRKHPGQDRLLQVQWVSELVAPSADVLDQPDLLRHLESFDTQTDTLLRTLAVSLEELIVMDRHVPASPTRSLSAGQLRAALDGVLAVVFDVHRTRGKIEEWFSTVEDPRKARAAQTLAAVRRKIEFLTSQSAPSKALPLAEMPLDRQALAALTGRIEQLHGMPAMSGGREAAASGSQLRRLIARPAVLARLLRIDRFIENRLQSAPSASWLAGYRRVRSRIRQLLAS
ncbi:MAG TPA: glycosyltransferase [Vicinamibacterales bacterium]